MKLDNKEYVKTDKEKLLQLKREYEEDPFTALENSNTANRRVSINFSKGAKKKLLKKRREELEKKNNPIELE